MRDTAKYQKFTLHTGLIGLVDNILNLRSLVIIPLITKLVGPSGYGVLAQVGLILMWLAPVHGAGLGSAMTRFLAPENDRGRIREGFYTIVVTRFFLGLGLALILYLLAAPLSNTFFKGADAQPVIQLAAAMIPIGAGRALCMHYFLIFRQIRIYNILRLAEGLGEILLTVGLVLAGWGVYGAVLSSLVSSIIGGGVAFSLVVSQIGVKWPNFSLLRGYLNFGSAFSLISFLRLISDTSDRYVIGYFLGVTWVGIYAAAYSIGKWVNEIVLSPLLAVLVPTLSKSYDEGKKEDVRNYLRYSMRYYLMVAIPGFFGVSLLGKQVLRIFTTDEFRAGYLVIPFVALSLVLYGGIYSLYAAQILKLVKKPQILMPIWGIATVANIGLNILFVPRFGILVAAVTTLLSYSLAVGFTVYFASRHWACEADWSFIVKSLAASAAMSLVILIMKPSPNWEAFLAIAVGIVVYALSLFLLGGLRKNEVLFFYQVAKKSFHLAK